jgi:hypothetical protein
LSLMKVIQSGINASLGRAFASVTTMWRFNAALRC